ncbi:MAG: histidinol-phosphate aminotransferase family protein [Chloroflexi bacterium]|nr:histidinol-phosphate aminotransferase family protein [Chloroflexota bacterium]
MAEPAQHITDPDPAADRPVHGGIKPTELRALGLRPEDVLDFSASVSPIGQPSGVWEAMRNVDLSAYPDPQCLELREALSRSLTHAEHRPNGVPLDRILVGNGSTEIIHLLARAYLSNPPDGAANNVFLLTPTYGEYQGACRLAGAAVSCCDVQEGSAFRWDMEDAAQRIRQEQPSLVFVCNPNNPTGVFLQREEVEALADASARVGGLLVVDEAYLSFVDEPWDSVSLVDRGNVVLLRSMTKDYALTGLRLGYCLASEEITRRLASFQPDWSVNGLAQAAGVAALADTAYLPRARQAVEQAKGYLTEQLGKLGFTVYPSAANFLPVRVGDAASWRDNLARKGIFVRDCTSFGLPEYIRIGIRSLADCQRLVEAVESLSYS